MLVSPNPATSRSSRTLVVRHATRFTYDRPVPRSFQRLYLTPVDDRRQHLLEHSLSIEPHAETRAFEDPFGNWANVLEVEEPFRELSVVAASRVQLFSEDPFAFSKSSARRPTLPLTWLPSERIMLAPYLTADELPEPQIRELSEYARSFVERNGGDLLEALFAVNLTLFREYKYAPGTTNLKTTAFDVYTTKSGVCQDFAGLFINLARLLGVPARYVCGYIYTGNCGESRAGSDATHAWVELYLPTIGWKGFDPTNGVLPATDHVRVARGRAWPDTAPTSGTIYGPAVETMTTDVEVVDESPTASAERQPETPAMATAPPA